MRVKSKEKIIPIEYEGWDTCGDFGDIQFYNVTFLEDWGSFSKGENVGCLTISQNHGTIEVYDKNGEKTKSCKFKLTPV